MYGDVSRMRYSIGKYKYLSIEKMIDTLADDSGFGIVLGVEHNLRIRTVASSYDDKTTTPQYQRYGII